MDGSAPIHGEARVRELLQIVGCGDLPAFLALPPGDQVRRIEAQLRRLRDDEMRYVMRRVGPELAKPFLPFPGTQTAAMLSPADILLFGGEAGGGKTGLLAGVAGYHRLSGLFRREGTQLDGLIAEVQRIFGAEDYVDREHRGGGRLIRLGGIRDPDDWRQYAGRPRDYLGFDEAGEFLEEQVLGLLAWLRSPDPDQRCRVILASNPPRTAEGWWLLEWFAPWLDPGFPNPARPGELRWAIRVGDKLEWVDAPEPQERGGEIRFPMSYTFIPSALKDNPFQDQQAYRARLDNVSPVLRRQLLFGDWFAGREDDAWQVIPTAWIQAARQRWTPEPPKGVPMTSIGVDVAQGGADRTVLAPRHGKWFAPLRAVDGVDTKNGPSVAGLVLSAMRDGCTVVVDMGGGYGGSAFDHLETMLPEGSVIGVVPGSGSDKRTRDGLRSFQNRRAELWWKFREALDPETGANIALPPDTELAAELAMPRQNPRRLNPILIESKEEIRKRLGRSTDKADAVIEAWAYGDERAAARNTTYSLPTMANLGYADSKRSNAPPPFRGELPSRANLGYAARRA